MRTTIGWLLLLAACGDDAVVVDAGTPLDASSDANIRDAGSDDASIGAVDAGAPECGPCDAEAPWRCETCLPTVLQEITAVSMDGVVHVLGGFEGGSVVGTLRTYDPATARWTNGPALPDPRHHVQLAAHEGALYAFGGMRDVTFTALRRSWVLRPGADGWEEIAAMPRPRAAGVAFGIGDRVYVAAGQGEGRTNAEKLADAAPVLIYDPAEDTWSEGASIPTTREHVAGFAWGDELYVLGGRPVSLEPSMDVVEIYDPAADEWRAGPSMLDTHGGFAAAVLGDVAIACGGETRAVALDACEALDLPAGRWRAIEPVPTPRHGHAMATAGERVFVIGGADEPVFAAVDVVESYAPE